MLLVIMSVTILWYGDGVSNIHHSEEVYMLVAVGKDTQAVTL